jgi:beta-galactosidase
VEGRRAVLLPGLFSPRPAFVDALEASGAEIVAGVRSGSKTPDFQIPASLPPGELQRLIPLKVRRVESLRPGVRIEAAGSNAGGGFDGWREFLVTGEGAEVEIAASDGEPMLVRSRRTRYLAGRPDRALAEQVVLKLLDAAGVSMLQLHPDVRVRDNGALRYVFNYGPEPVEIADLVGGAELLLGSLKLPPCGVAAFRRR